MKKNKSIKVHNTEALAKTLGLSSADAHRWEFRSQLVTKIIEIAEREKITHAEIAKRARTSRTRVTSIANRNIDDVSTDLLLRILESLGYRVTFSVVRQRAAA
jgi:predicted XRE-type DNA-binding protein